MFGLLFMSPPLLHWLFTHCSYWQGLVPRSPARIYLWPTVPSQISARISLQILQSYIRRNSGRGFSAARNRAHETALKLHMKVHIKRMPVNAIRS